MTTTHSRQRLKYASCLLAVFILSCGNPYAQSIRIHKTDGSMQEFPQSDIDSIAYEDIPHYETPRSQSANLTLEVSTDSACYHPGSTVKFKHNGSAIMRARVRYMHLGEVLYEEDLPGVEWTWKTPSEDFKGYMVQVYQTSAGQETIRATIAVDVSSDWKKFPRYGFVADFGSSKTASVTAKEMDWLNRCHINGVQFQDWHYKHHWPWGGTKEGVPLETYTDIANRTIYTSSVENYIKAQHDRGMKSIFYNLCYGALSDAVEDGVSNTCFLYTDAAHTNRDCHKLPSSWKSDIYVVNPGMTTWTYYMNKRIAEVYDHLDFDGFQIDQLGYRGTLYNISGEEVDIPSGFATFIRAVKAKFPDKRLIMNAVGSYGTKEIAGTRKMDFLYNEVWDGEKNYADLYNILENNRKLGGDTLQTVFAAYMNYNLDNTQFNLPGVTMADAVMFALGGSHLELGGDHMLCREYFPYSSVSMSDALKKRITWYYDFMTAYENLLRDGGTLNTSASLVPTDTSGEVSINGWAPQLGGVTTIAREKEGCTVLHFLNFISANSLSWRDMDGTMPAATTKTNIPLRMSYAQPVKHIYVATPDKLGGAMNELDFTQTGGTLTFTLPYLNYWTMVVIQE
ncbi:MAG: glycoside hydrolase family 66 protein [Bacteroidaceae bacterium]